jgi:uncharacterized protein (TIGR03067 family)
MTAKIGLCLAAAFMVSAGGDDAAKVKSELKKLDGTWTVNELVYNGKDHKNLRFNFVFKGDEAVVEGNDRVKQEYARIKVKFDPGTMPKIMDITVVAGLQKSAAMEGIYEFKQDQLRICVKVFGKDRPTEFASPDASSVVLMVLKRPTP